MSDFFLYFTGFTVQFNHKGGAMIIDFRLARHLFFRSLIVLGLILTSNFISGSLPVFAADLCKQGARDLRGSYEALQGRGGIWALMERSSALKDKSVLGLQVDTKLQRAVVNFENRCAPDSKNKPTPELYDTIQDRLSEARNINNQRPGKIPPDKMLAMIESLIEKLDGLLKTL